jgi:hypothetical protein
MATFTNNFNYDDIFFRDITVGLIATLHRKISWDYNFTQGKKKVTVPFYYNLVGEERFLMDAFIDDVTGKRPELNTDPVPRGTVTLNGWTRKTSEYTNPNVRYLNYVEEGDMLKKVYAKYRFVPMKLTYDISILLNNESDIFRCSQAITELFSFYKHYNIEYKYMRIDAVMMMPDTHNTEITRDIAGISRDEQKKTITFSVDVHTSLPVEPVTKGIDYNQRVQVKGRVKTLGLKGSKRQMFGELSMADYKKKKGLN